VITPPYGVAIDKPLRQAAWITSVTNGRTDSSNSVRLTTRAKILKDLLGSCK